MEYPESLASFFRHLFMWQDFLPHGHCYLWRPEIVWTMVLSDASIALSYYSIPVALVYFVAKRKDLAFKWIFVAFGVFIIACGTTHLMNIWTLWQPVYRLDGVIKVFTGLVSVATAIVVWPLIPKALALPSPEQLRKANEKLREAERIKDAFFANVSHELKTPLTLLLAPLESLLTERSEVAVPDHRQLLQTMHNNTIRLFQMVTSLLDFSKLQAGKIEVNREHVEIVELTRSILADFEPTLKHKRLSATLDADLSEAFILMDRYLYERIVFNLLSNAVKFTPEGGSIAVVLRWNDDRLRLEVRDTGIGISEVDITTLFQKFRQVEASSTRRFEGTGLGLALVKEFAELLGGSVCVESVVGKGSTFTVEYLAPRSQASKTWVSPARSNVNRLQRYVTAAPTEPRPTDGAPDGRPKVLVAEDNAELSSYIASLLAKECQVTIAQDGEEALTLVQNWLPDLILSDVMMPKRDGLSVCKTVKDNPHTASIPVILLTALTHREALVKGREAGADEYLFKPFHPLELTKRVSSMLSAAQTRKEAEKQLKHQNELLVRHQKALLHALANLKKANAELHAIQLQVVRAAKMEAVGRLAAGVAHEVKNPLAILLVGVDYLSRYVTTSKEQVAGVLRDMGDAVRRADGIIKGLLDFSSSEELDLKLADLNGVAEQALALVKHALDRNHVTVTKELAEHLPPLRQDHNKLEQVFINIFLNAIDAMPRGGTLSVKTYTKRLTEFGNLVGRRETDRFRIGETVVVAEVDDAGSGIPENNLSKIFDPFFSTKPTGQGTGLGLAVVKTIVDLHQGTIDIANRKEGGVRVTLMFPATAHPVPDGGKNGIAPLGTQPMQAPPG